MGSVLPLPRALETSLSLHPIDQKAFCRPRDHKQDVENSLSTLHRTIDDRAPVNRT